MMGALTELSQHTWAVILMVAVPVGAVVGFLVNVNALRRSTQERNKLVLEIAKLEADAERSVLNKAKLELEVEKLREDAVRQARADAKANRVIQQADLVEMQTALLRQRQREFEAREARELREEEEEKPEAKENARRLAKEAEAFRMAQLLGGGVSKFPAGAAAIDHSAEASGQEPMSGSSKTACPWRVVEIPREQENQQQKPDDAPNIIRPK